MTATDPTLTTITPPRRPSQRRALLPLSLVPFFPILLSTLPLIGTFLPRWLTFLLPLLPTAHILHTYTRKSSTTHIVPRRVTAQIDGDFVVFLIGAKLNTLNAWTGGEGIWTGEAFGAMVAELRQNPELGCLAIEEFFGADGAATDTLSVQYWRSAEDLHRYARDGMRKHLGPMMRSTKNSKLNPHPDIGIWHETYSVRAGEYESIYLNMPEFGLSRAGRMVDPGRARMTMMQRMGKVEEPDVVEGMRPYMDEL